MLYEFHTQFLLVLTLYSNSAGSPGSRSGRQCRCSPPAYSGPPAASFSSGPPSILQAGKCSFRHRTSALTNFKRHQNFFHHWSGSQEFLQLDAFKEDSKKGLWLFFVKWAHLSSWPGPPSLHTAVCASGLPPQAWQADCWNTQNIDAMRLWVIGFEFALFMWDRLVWHTETDRGTGQGNNQILKVHQELFGKPNDLYTNSLSFLKNHMIKCFKF